MITKCTINDVRSIAELWETCFTDNKEIISNYLNNCFPNSETYGYIVNGKIVSCITLIPCYYYIDNQIVYGKYLFGVCTDPNYRGKNLSKQIFDYYLTTYSEKDDYIFTHPAEESLYRIYKKWGFDTELYSINQEISKHLLEEAIVSNPSNTANELSNLFADLISNLAKNNIDSIILANNIDSIIPANNIDSKITANIIDPIINNTSSYKTDSNLKNTLNNITDKENDAKEYQTNQKLQHKESHKINNPSYFFQTLEDFNKHDTDQILSKIQKLRSKNIKIFQFSNEILLFFLRDLLINNTHIYISDNNYAFYSTSHSTINLIEIHQESSSNLSTYTNRHKESYIESDNTSNIKSRTEPSQKPNTESLFKSNKTTPAEPNKTTTEESNTPNNSVEHIFTSTKTRVNGLIYAKNPKLDKSSLPSITLTGE